MPRTDRKYEAYNAWINGLRRGLGDAFARHSFYERVRKNTFTGCWEWTGATYGRRPIFSPVAGQPIDAANFSGRLHRMEGAKFFPACNNFRCVNPTHLTSAPTRTVIEAYDSNPRIIGNLAFPVKYVISILGGSRGYVSKWRKKNFDKLVFTKPAGGHPALKFRGCRTSRLIREINGKH